MGEKFQKQLQQALRQRVDALEQALVKNDKPLKDFVDKNALAPLFVCAGRQVSVGVERRSHYSAPHYHLDEPVGTR